MNTNDPTIYFDVTLDEEQVKLLRDTIVIGDDADDLAPIRLVVGAGHSGYGLYLAQAEYQDEGAVLLQAAPPREPMKAADEFELRRLLAEERETTRQLTRALAEATEGPTFMGEPVPQAKLARLVLQVRDVCAATLRAGPGVAVEIPAELAEEGRKFMRGEPSLIEQMPFADVQNLGNVLNAA